jgi:hypothetical protein
MTHAMLNNSIAETGDIHLLGVESLTPEAVATFPKFLGRYSAPEKNAPVPNHLKHFHHRVGQIEPGNGVLGSPYPTRSLA